MTKFFKNYRVYLLTSVAYLGSLLFGAYLFCASHSPMSRLLTGNAPVKAMTRV